MKYPKIGNHSYFSKIKRFLPGLLLLPIQGFSQVLHTNEYNVIGAEVSNKMVIIILAILGLLLYTKYYNFDIDD